MSYSNRDVETLLLFQHLMPQLWLTGLVKKQGRHSFVAIAQAFLA